MKFELYILAAAPVAIALPLAQPAGHERSDLQATTDLAEQTYDHGHHATSVDESQSKSDFAARNFHHDSTCAYRALHQRAPSANLDPFRILSYYNLQAAAAAVDGNNSDDTDLTDGNEPGSIIKQPEPEPRSSVKRVSKPEPEPASETGNTGSPDGHAWRSQGGGGYGQNRRSSDASSSPVPGSSRTPSPGPVAVSENFGFGVMYDMYKRERSQEGGKSTSTSEETPSPTLTDCPGILSSGDDAGGCYGTRKRRVDVKEGAKPWQRRAEDRSIVGKWSSGSRDVEY